MYVLMFIWIEIGFHGYSYVNRPTKVVYTSNVISCVIRTVFAAIGKYLPNTYIIYYRYVDMYLYRYCVLYCGIYFYDLTHYSVTVHIVYNFQ